MNPILRKEMRSLLRERRGWLVPCLYGALLSSIALMSGRAPAETNIDPRPFAIAAASAVAGLQTVVVGLIAPILGAASIASERERGTWMRLLGAPIARSQIAAGKVAATGMYVVLVLLVPLPVLALTLLFGGMDGASLAGLYTAHLLLGVALGCLGLAVSTAFHRTWVATVVAIALVSTLTVAAEMGAHSIQVVSNGHSLWADIVQSFSPIRGTELFFSGDRMEGSRRLWAMHFGALAGMAAVAVALVAARLRSMVE